MTFEWNHINQSTDDFFFFFIRHLRQFIAFYSKFIKCIQPIQVSNNNKYFISHGLYFYNTQTLQLTAFMRQIEGMYHLVDVVHYLHYFTGKTDHVRRMPILEIFYFICWYSLIYIIKVHKHVCVISEASRSLNCYTW